MVRDWDWLNCGKSSKFLFCVCGTCECQIKQLQKALGLFFCESSAWFSSALLCNKAAGQDEDLSLFLGELQSTSSHLWLANVNYSYEMVQILHWIAGHQCFMSAIKQKEVVLHTAVYEGNRYMKIKTNTLSTSRKTLADCSVGSLFDEAAGPNLICYSRKRK